MIVILTILPRTCLFTLMINIKFNKFMESLVKKTECVQDHTIEVKNSANHSSPSVADFWNINFKNNSGQVDFYFRKDKLFHLHTQPPPTERVMSKQFNVNRISSCNLCARYLNSVLNFYTNFRCLLLKSNNLNNFWNVLFEE